MRRIFVGAAVVGVLALSGCGGGGPEVTPPAAAPSSEAVGVKSVTPEAASESPTMSGAEKFGSTATWPDGVSVAVGVPNPFVPSGTSSAETPRAKAYMVVELALKNGSSAPVEASMTQLRATSGDQEATQVFDSEKGIDMPTARVLPGKSLRWKAVFPKDGPDLAVTVEWNFQGPVTFQ